MCRRVELGHELAVGGAGGGEVLTGLLELETQVDDVLLEGEVLLLERVDVGGSAESGLAPGVFAEQAGEPAFELLDAGGSRWVLSRSACNDAWLTAGPVPAAAGAWAWGGVDLLDQVQRAVP